MQSRDASRCRATARTWGLLALLASTLGACDDSSSGGEADTGPAPIPRDAANEAPAADSSTGEPAPEDAAASEPDAAERARDAGASTDAAVEPDAAGSGPDAGATPDAAPGTPDAAMQAPDAGSDPDATPELLDAGIQGDAGAQPDAAPEPEPDAAPEPPDAMVEPPAGVAWCRLQGPLDVQYTPGGSERVFGRVRIPGITDRTDGTDADPQVLGQVGWILVGPNPPAPALWQWAPGRANAAWDAANAGEPDVDEYVADLAIDGDLFDEYFYAWRFSADGGASWTYCDADRGAGRDGSEDGFEVNATGVVRIDD